MHKHPSFAASTLSSPISQHKLVSAKKAKLWELVGEVEEDEPEGEAVVGPSGEATTHSSGITLPLFLILIQLCIKILFQNFLFFFLQPILPVLTLFFLSDNSAEEGVLKLQAKEERDIDTLWSWVQMGGFPA